MKTIPTPAPQQYYDDCCSTAGCETERADDQKSTKLETSRAIDDCPSTLTPTPLTTLEHTQTNIASRYSVASDDLTYQEVWHQNGEKRYTCALLCADGPQCEAFFVKVRAFKMHQVSHPSHKGQRKISCAIANQCPMCEAVLARREAAIQHVHTAIARGYCYASQQISMPKLVIPMSLSASCAMLNLRN